MSQVKNQGYIDSVMINVNSIISVCVSGLNEANDVWNKLPQEEQPKVYNLLYYQQQEALKKCYNDLF